MKRLQQCSSRVLQQSTVAAFASRRWATSVASFQSTQLDVSRLTPELIADFHKDGIVCIPEFLPIAQVDALKAELARLVTSEAELRSKEGDEGKVSVFETEKKTTFDDDYFMSSGNKVRYFLEDGCSQVSMTSVNKVAHALHTDGGVFQQFSSQIAFGAMLRKVGQYQPNVIQSMYIMKPPKVGGAVVPHQDSTWLHTRPLSVIGLWFALDDCTVHNSCLHALKGSHFTHMPLSAHSVLNEDKKSSTLLGTLPDVKLEQMAPLECKKGSMLMFCGQVIHASGPNKSDKARHAYTMHSVDDQCAWNEKNWLAPYVARLAL